VRVRTETPARARGPGWSPPFGSTRLRSSAWVALVALAAIGLYRLAGAWGEGVGTGHDFVQDYAAIHAIAAGRNPYEPYNDVTQQLFGGPPHKGKLYSFHAPSSLIFFMPLLPLPYHGAFVAWGLASLAALWAICGLTLRLIGVRAWAALGALVGLALVALPPIRENFVEGQLNVLVMAGAVAAWSAYRADRPALAGLSLGAAFALKPIPGLFFLYFLWKRQWRLLAAAAGALALLNLVGLLLAGVDGYWLYATVNYPDHAALWPGYPDNASIRGFFTRLFGPSTWRRPAYSIPGAALILWALAGLVLSTLGWLAARRRSADATAESGGAGGADLDLAALAVLSLLVAPIIWPHYYVALIPPIMILAAYVTTRDRLPRPWAFVGLATLAGAATVLATAHYTEPYRGVGGQQLAALLVLYAVALAALWDRGRRSATRDEAVGAQVVG
jgi:alpha-1,2-mannosyltransferase